MEVSHDRDNREIRLARNFRHDRCGWRLGSTPRRRIRRSGPIDRLSHLHASPQNEPTASRENFDERACSSKLAGCLTFVAPLVAQN
jgi:hypothetical protein